VRSRAPQDLKIAEWQEKEIFAPKHILRRPDMLTETSIYKKTKKMVR